MRVELSQKEIELLLLLMNDMFSDGMGGDDAPIMSLEERVLMEKLESALRNTSVFEKSILDVNSSNLSH
jgi:hypothetical protein